MLSLLIAGALLPCFVRGEAGHVRTPIAWGTTLSRPQYPDSASFSVYGLRAMVIGLDSYGGSNVYKDPHYADTTIYGLSLGLLATEDQTVYGIQLSTFVSQADVMTGIQAAAFFNNTEEKFTGIQGAFFLSYAKNMYGVQGALMFSAAENLTGIQGAFFGGGNIVHSRMRGIQMAFIGGNRAGDAAGMQLSLWANEAEKINGAQIGLYNKAETIHGAQIGIYNHAQSLRGVQIGLLNRHGERYSPLLMVGW